MAGGETRTTAATAGEGLCSKVTPPPAPRAPRLGLLFSVPPFPGFFPALEFQGANPRRAAT